MDNGYWSNGKYYNSSGRPPIQGAEALISILGFFLIVTFVGGLAAKGLKGFVDKAESSKTSATKMASKSGDTLFEGVALSKIFVQVSELPPTAFLNPSDADRARIESFVNDQGTLHFDNGDSFEGNLAGLGRYTWKDGRFYYGKWVSGKRHGSGTQRFDRFGPEMFVGKFSEDKIGSEGQYWFVPPKWEGIGQFYLCKYEGELRDSQANGKGILLAPEGSHVKERITYDGSWSNGRFDGFGVFRNAKGESYLGHFEKGIPSGSGK